MSRRAIAFACPLVVLCHFAIWPLSHPIAFADPPTNGTYTITQDVISSGGGQVGGGNPMRLLSSGGQPTSGLTSNPTLSARIGYPAEIPPWPPGNRMINVSGTIDDSTATVTVNGIPATITGGTFLAQGIQIVEGPNTITATATDPAGNIGSHTITVFLDTQPPPMPTVATHLAVVPLGNTTYQLCGTKVAGTTIWTNGQLVPGVDPGATTWCATFSPLLEGDNPLTIVAKDAAGNSSATVTANIILDNLPPVVSNLAYVDTQGAPLNLDPVTNLPKTNFSPVTTTGQVDDSLTVVTINGQPDTASGRPFQVAVPLTVGTNALTLIATSPNNLVTNQPLQVIQGTIPTITSVQPPHASKPYAELTTTIQISATDAENDPLQYQILLDGQVILPWGSTNTTTWTPALADLGLHTIEARAKDDFGGFASQQPQVYVVRQPIAPPQ